MRYIDFHTHILPKIDDGAKSLNESVEMLRTAKRCGAELVVLTPHYTSDISIAEFCELRQKKYLELKAEVLKNKDEFPKLLLGAEVLVNNALSENDDIKSLCISETNLLMVELPYDKWQKWHYNEVYNLVAKHSITPVIAHVERYLTKVEDLKKLEPLISVGAKFQINADSFLSFFGKRIIRELAAMGLISAIGSDCHGATFRSPDISRAISVFSKKFGEPFMDYLYEKSSKLLNESRI